jgi:hypothetical protein
MPQSHCAYEAGSGHAPAVVSYSYSPKVVVLNHESNKHPFGIGIESVIDDVSHSRA